MQNSLIVDLPLSTFIYQDVDRVLGTSVPSAQTTKIPQEILTHTLSLFLFRGQNQYSQRWNYPPLSSLSTLSIYCLYIVYTMGMSIFCLT